MKRNYLIVIVLLFMLFILAPTNQADAKSKIRFAKKNVTIDIYKQTSTTLKIKKSGVVGTTYFTSSNPKVATVSSRGYVVARGKFGKATITAYCGRFKAKCKVRVKSSRVDFDPLNKDFGVTKGYSSGINYATKGTFSKPTWKSSNKKIATVDSIGKVTGINCGTTVITGSVNGKKRKIRIHVEAPNTVVKAYTDFLSQDMVPAGPSDIPTEREHIDFSFVNVDQDGIGELAVFASEGGAGYSQYNNGTLYTFRDGKMLKLGNITCGIVSPCKWETHLSHKNIVISTLTYIPEDDLYKEFYYQIKNDRIILLTQSSMTKDKWSSPYKDFTYANAAGTPITKEAREALLKTLELGSVIVNYLHEDSTYGRSKVFR